MVIPGILWSCQCDVRHLRVLGPQTRRSYPHPGVGGSEPQQSVQSEPAKSNWCKVEMSTKINMLCMLLSHVGKVCHWPLLTCSLYSQIVITRIMKHKGILFLPVLILRVIFGPFWVLMTLSRLLALLSSSTQDPYTLSRLNHLSTGYPYTLSTQVVKFQMIVWKKDGEWLYPSLKQSKTENIKLKSIFPIPPNDHLYTFSNEYWERP